MKPEISVHISPTLFNFSSAQKLLFYYTEALVGSATPKWADGGGFMKGYAL